MFPNAVLSSPFRFPFSRLAWPIFLFVFGFLLASFPARNFDIWGHLATGRSWGTDLNGVPSFTSLFDIIVYVGYALGDGSLLVFLKALSMGLLGVVLYRTAKSSTTTPILPAVVVGLILMTISLRTNLQPQTATYLLLGLTVFWLSRNPLLPTRTGNWLLIGLFLACWANLDRGFVYGLAAFSLIWLGRSLNRSSAIPHLTRKLPPLRNRVALAFVLLACACLLNPAHLSITLFDPIRRGEFPLPTELRWLTNRHAAELLRSPFTETYLRSIRESPAALAYYPLLLLCLVGFVWNRAGFRWERFLPTALFGLLSVLSDRAIPIFAVVCGPMASLNLCEALARRRTRSPEETASSSRRWIFAAIQLLLATAFLLAAWPGWLQRAPYEPRRWAFDLPDSPAAASDFLRSRGSPAGTAGRCLHLSAESQMAFRWYCPEDDGRYDAKMVAALLKGESIDAELRTGGYSRIVLYHPDLEQMRPALNALLRDRYRWPLLYIGGDTAIFGWRDPAWGDDPYAGRAIDPTRLWLPSPESVRAPVPLGGPGLATPTWQEATRATFTRPRTIHSRDREEAALLLMMAEVSKRWIPQLNGEGWIFEQIAGLVGGAIGSANPLLSATGTALRFNYFSPPVSATGQPTPLYEMAERQFEHAQASRDDFLPGAMAAAIRAGRRAVVDHPDDPRAAILLGEAYLMVLLYSHERVGSREFKQLRELRQAQAAAALHRAVRLRTTPSSKAHRLMAQMFRGIGYFDLSLEHLTAARKAEKSSAPNEKLDPDQERDFATLQEQVAQRREKFDKDSNGLRVMDRATIADEMNLPGLALELLLKSDISAFGTAGLKLQLELMVRTGRAAEVIEWTYPEQRESVGHRNYHWWRAQAFAGLGDYTSADRELVEIGGGAIEVIPDPDLLVATAAAIVSKNVLGEAPHGTGLPDTVRRMLARSDAVGELSKMESQLKNLAEVSVLRGTLALEIGDWREARRHGEAALDFAPLRSGRFATPLRVMGQNLVDRAAPLDGSIRK